MPAPRTRSRLLVAAALVALVALRSVSAAASDQSDARVPACGESGRTMSLVRQIAATLTFSRYNHSTRVDARSGRFEFDCSGMTAWVLARTAPLAHRAVLTRTRSGRPLARDYYHTIASSPTVREASGWQRVARVSDAEPGDVIAWIRPAIVQSANTGHVAFVVAAPVAVPEMPGAYLVRIADASSYQHEDDSRAGTGRTGFGYGTILIVADPSTGAPVSYGWFGRLSAWVLETQIAIGRPVR